MTWFLVLWISWVCPGGWLGAKTIPAEHQRFVCTAKPDWTVESNREHALKKVRQAGCQARFFECHGLRCREKEVSCETKLSVEGT